MDNQIKVISDESVLARILAAQHVQAKILCEILGKVKPHLDERSIFDTYCSDVDKILNEMYPKAPEQ